MSRNRNHVFTINNYSNEEQEGLRTLADTAQVRYLVFGRETGESGTPHLQGYVEWTSGVSMATARGRLGGRAHVEGRMGTSAEASDYCKKDGDFEEWGEMSRPGRRTDLSALKADCEAGQSLRDLAQGHFSNFIRYNRGIMLYRSLISEPRNFVTEVRVFWGVAGTGKSRRAYAEAEDPWVWGGDHWFDGYDNHDHVIMDDFRGSCMKPSMFLKITDRYPCRVPVKGAFVNWRPRIIWITSNVDPALWWPNVDPETARAVARRLTQVVSFSSDLIE